MPRGALLPTVVVLLDARLVVWPGATGCCVTCDVAVAPLRLFTACVDCGLAPRDGLARPVARNRQQPCTILARSSTVAIVSSRSYVVATRDLFRLRAQQRRKSAWLRCRSCPWDNNRPTATSKLQLASGFQTVPALCIFHFCVLSPSTTVGCSLVDPARARGSPLVRTCCNMLNTSAAKDMGSHI